MEMIMQFMYLGEAMISKEKMKDFLHAAIDLGIQEIDDNVDYFDADDSNDEQDLHSDTVQDQYEDETFETKPPAHINTTTDIAEPSYSDPVTATKSVQGDQNYPQTSNKSVQGDQNYPQSSQKTVVERKSVKRKQTESVETPKKFRQLMPKGPLKTLTIVGTDTGSNSGVLNCPKCDSVFVSKIGLQCHIDSKHYNIKHPCKQCDHQASSYSNLRKHVQVMHEGVRYPCKHCNYKATRAEYLRSHIFSKHT